MAQERSLQQWAQELAEIMPQVTAIRRDFHRQPELGGEEVQTKKRLMAELEALGLEVTTFHDCHAVMATLRNGEGRCVAIRADMDALPVQEETSLGFASEVPGRMHACGHDAHMALALGSAMWMSAHRDQWQGTMKWLFEPAEETFGGGRLMVEQGCMENPRVDVVIGQHMNPRYEAGTFFARPGFVSGSSDMLRLTVRGSSCHGAYPESGTDAIVIAAQVITALQTLVSRRISPFDPAVLTLGTIEGGTANNIICGEVRMKGTLRTMEPATRQRLYQEITALVRGTAQAMSGEADVDILPGYGAVYNDDACYALVEAQAAALLGQERIVRRDLPSLGVESFCYFVQHTPGVYYDLGCGEGTALHTPTFCVDEACLLPGVALQCASALALLAQ